MIAAIYARKSNEQNGVADESKSVTRRVDHAKPMPRGWHVGDEFVFVDDGIGGAECASRPGFMRLLNAGQRWTGNGLNTWRQSRLRAKSTPWLEPFRRVIRTEGDCSTNLERSTD